MNFFFGVNESFKPYSTFHIVFMVFFVVLDIIAIFFMRKCKDKTLRIFIFVAWIIVVVFEVLKQINWGYDLSTRTWYGLQPMALPYQFCSLPLYLWPLVIFLPDSKFRKAISLFCATYVFFTGFGYLFVGSSICSRVLISHQTMIHHGLQSMVGIILFVHEYKKFSFKTYLQSSMFLVFLAPIAVILNVLLSPIEPSMNLWEINPLNPSQAIIYKQVFEATNYPVFYITYLILFFCLSTVFYFILKGLVELFLWLYRKYNSKKMVSE